MQIVYESIHNVREMSIMGQKDITEKILEAYNDVFADIVNVLLFNGERVLKENEMEDQVLRTAYKADGKYREMERDVAKRWKNGNIRLACIGLENQTEPDADMPLRIMGYDGAEYRSQMNIKDQKERYPVITLVLYYGYTKHWDKPLSLMERLSVPERLKPFVNDYKVNLFEIAYISSEQVKLFQSDFRVVADYFVQMRTTGTYVGSKERIVHLQETLSLMSVMTGDDRFEDVLYEENETEGVVIKTMCDVLDRIEEKGRVEGRAEGRKEGRKEGKNDILHLMQKLFADGRVDDAKKASEDPAYCEKLIEEYLIQKV